MKLSTITGLVWLLLLFIAVGKVAGQTNCTPTPKILIGYDWESSGSGKYGCVDKLQNPGEAAYLIGFSPALNYWGHNEFCPQIVGGCGTAYFGSKSHNNTANYYNAVCLAGYYGPNSCGWDPKSKVFNPTNCNNMYINYTVPAGKKASLTKFQILIRQPYLVGTPNFESIGLAVLKNGVEIFRETQTITVDKIYNKRPFEFNLSGIDFQTDGEKDVKYTFLFGLVYFQDPKGAQGQTGFDDIFIYGTCDQPIVAASAIPATCDAQQGALSNGQIKLAGFDATDKYDYTLGSTYSGTATYASGSTTIATGGVIANNLPNPVSAQLYTVRVFKASGCTQDIVVKLLPKVCPGNCSGPSGGTLNTILATCSGTTANNDAKVTLTGVTNADKIGLSAGSIYTGPVYSAASSLTAGGFTFQGLANPTQAGHQIYTVRIYNGSNQCYVDKKVDLMDAGCAPCTKACAEIIASGARDPDSSPDNGATTEDDYACYESCKDNTYIDLKLTKAVTPQNGVTCPVATNFTWTITIRNAGNMAAKDIIVKDLFPADFSSISPQLLAFVSVNATKGRINTFAVDGAWTLDDLQAGESATLTFVTKALRPGTLTNCAEVVSATPLNDPNSTPGNGVTTEDDYACASITVTGTTPPSVKKSFSPGKTRTNTPTRLTLTLTNNESTPITLTANLVDDLPKTPGQMVIAPSPNVSTTNGIAVIAVAGGTSFFIPSGQVLLPGTTQISMDIVVPVDGVYCNVIPAGALQTSSCANIKPDTSCVLADSQYPMAPIITKAFSPKLIEKNQNSTLTLTVENRNSVPMTLNADFVDFLPANLLVNGTPTGTCPGVSVTNGNSEIRLVKGTILAPGTCTIVVPVSSSVVGKYCNRIGMNAMSTTVGTFNDIGNLDIAEACVEVLNNPIFDLALTKKLAVGQKSSVLVGDIVTNNIEVINQGTVTATNVQVTDYIPSSMSLVADANWSQSGTNAVLSTPIASLSAGQSVTIPIQLKILSGVKGDTLVNKAEISSASGGTDIDSRPDANPANDAGGRFNSPSDDSVNGNGTGTPGDRSGLTDEDDEDPSWVVLTQCDNSNLAAGVILSPKAIRSQNDVVQITFGLTNPGGVPLTGIAFVGQVKPFNRPNGAPVSLTLTKQGDINNDGIMQPNEAWVYTGTFSSTYTPGTVFLVTGAATASCGSATINAATADLLYTVGVNMDVVIKDKCYQPGSTLEVDLITRLLIDEDAATNPGSITLGGITIPLPKRRFEARGLMITVQGVNNGQPFDPFNPPAGVTLTRFTDQGSDQGRNTGNVLDELDPVNTVRAPCTTMGQDDVGCEFPDWVFHLQIPVSSTYTGNTFSVTASDQFQLFQSVENPAGSGSFEAFTDITPGSGAGGADTDMVPVCLDLALTKKLATGQAAVVSSGSTVKFTITVYNQGSVPAYNVKLVDYIPAGLTLADSKWTSTSANMATLTNAIAGPIAVGGSAEVDISFTVNAGVTGDLVNKAEITSADDDTDPNNTSPFDSDSRYDTDPTNDAGGKEKTASDDAIRGNGTGTPGSADAATDEDDEDPAVITVNNCNKPVLTVGNVVCNGTSYDLVYYSSVANVTSSAGTLAANRVTGIPLGTNVILTATESAGCATTLTVEGPTICPTSCTTPLLTVGQPICDGTTYSISFMASPGALVTSTNGTVVGNTIRGIAIGSNVIVSATTGTCVAKVDVVSPASCTNPCENPGISLSGPLCTSANTGYTLNYTLTSGASVRSSDGTVSNGTIANIQLGRAVSLTISMPGCPDKVVVVSAPSACAVGSIGDYVWKDANNNGIQDPTESGVSNVVVQLLNSSGTLVTSTTTNASGLYSFTNLAGGTYQVKIVSSSLPAGCVLSSQVNQGNDDTKDNDFDPATGLSQLVTIDPYGAGQNKNNPTVDAGLVFSKACLGDYVWLDSNQNGIQDATESGVASVTAVLYDAVSNTVVSSMVTDGSGRYRFCNLNPGSYYVKFTPPSGVTFTTPNSGGNDGVDSDPGPNGITPVYSLTPGQDEPSVDAGLVPLKACLGDYVWLDSNQNGIQDATESGVASVTAVLYDAVSNTVVSSTVTDGSGRYRFCNLNPGSYYVKFTPPSGVTFTTPNSGGNDGVDSDPGPNGITPVYSLTPGQDEPSVDAGLVPLKACLGDYVWLDSNQNGIQDATESGVASVTAVLYDAVSNTVVSSTVTDGSGRYRFCNLNPGSYYVKFTPPSGVTFTTPNSGGNDGVDSDPGPNGITPVYSLTPGQDEPSVDAGLVPLKACLGDYVWLDSNQNGIQDATESGVASVTAVLYDAVSNTVVSSTVTDGSGRYRFCNLNPGSYYVKFTPPSGVTFTTPNSGGNDGVDSDPGPNGITPVYSLTPGQDEPSVDAGLVPLKACLGDYVWLDSNQNGIQDATESGVASVTAVLYDAVSNTVVSSTVTDGSGRYRFCNLNPGSYYVKFTPPSGVTFTTPNSGGNDGVDSDPGPNGITPVYSLTPGQDEPSVDAGLVPLKACLGDYVWLDSNQNGIQDATESGVASVTAVLYDAVSNTVVSSTVTDGSGRYRFCNLNPGSYYVKFTPPSGVTFTTPNSGGNDGVDSDPGPNGITPVYSLTPGQDEPSVDAGLVPLKACLGDYVWLDSNQNGIQDATESGVASVTAVLYDAVSNTVVSSTVTDGSGRYRFCNLNPGSYYVKFTPPSGVTFTTPNSGGNDGVDSDPGPNGITPVYSLTPGQDEPSVDAGLVPLKASLGDYVWYDNNRNGQQDAGEPGAVGVSVALYNATTNQLVSTLVTDGTGHYLFTGLDPGTYYVVFTAPGGSTFTTANVGNDSTDSDAGVGGRTGNYTLAGGGQDLTVDAGLVPQCTSPNCTTNVTVK